MKGTCPYCWRHVGAQVAAGTVQVVLMAHVAKRGEPGGSGRCPGSRRPPRKPV